MRHYLIAALLVVASAAHAQEDTEERDFNINQFRGWTGIVLRCTTTSKNTELADAICRNATTDFKFLAETAGVPYDVSVNEKMFHLTVRSLKMGHPIVLEIETNATADTQSAIGLHINIAGTSFYSDAVEKDAKPGEPEAMPKSGDFILWENSLTAVGRDNQSLAADVAPHVAQVFKQFFTDFLPGWKAGKSQ